MDEPFAPSYYVTVDEIRHCEWTLARLARLELVARAVGRLWPQGHPTRLVHVAGTAGKGSTCRFLEAGLGLAAKAGAFTSPELFDFREQFSVGGRPVSRADVTAAWERRVKPLAVELALANGEHALYAHEAATLLALALFEQHGVEWAAVETAVGGRYDQTRALAVEAALLTNVGRDHEEELGYVPWLRALDKAGIARPGVAFFTTEEEPENLSLIAGVCRDVGAPFHAVGEAEVDETAELLAAAAGGPLPAEALLAGRHQQRNAALALRALKHLVPEVAAEQAAARFLAVTLPGRSWQVEEGLYADVAHNPDKIAAVAADVERRFPGRGKIFVVGVTRELSPQAVLAPLLPLARALVVTCSTLGGQDPEAVKEEIDALETGVPCEIVPDPAEAIAAAKALRRPGEVVIVTGDMDVIDEALNPDPYLRYINAHVGWRTEGG